MAIREELVFDLSQALSQLDDLERQLDALIQPIVIPVDVETDQALDQLRRDIRAADADDIDIDVDVDGVARAEDEFEELRREVDKTDDELRKVERQAKATGDDLERAGKKGKGAFSGLTRGVLAFGAALGGIAALRGLIGFFGDAIDSASDLEESTSKAQVVFGSFFDDIQRFSTTAPQALGLANSAALEFTGTFGNLFVALGLSQQAAADLAPEIVQLGADLASFNNIEVTDALDKLRAGLVGEAEPLRALGVNLTAATTNAKAMELGLVDVNGVITEAAKVQARYALILEQTATAQGDFSRTSEGLANTQRTLNAELENFKAAVGEALVPAFEAILAAAPAALELLEDMIPILSDLATGFADAVEDGEGFIDFMRDLATAIGATSDVISGFGGFIGGTFAGLEDLTELRVDKAFDSWTEAMEDFDQTFTNLSVRKIKNTLIADLAEIDDPIRALVESIESLQFLDLDIDQFASTVERLFRIAGVDGPEAARIFGILSTRGGDFAFTADQVAVLDEAMRRLFGGVRGFAPPLDELNLSMQAVGATASDTAGELEEFARAGSKIRDADIDGIIADLETQFDRLPDALDGAAAALRDEENKIVEDFTDFLDNLTEELEAREAFVTDIVILRALGLDDLAQVFTEAGLESAAALADAIANPEEARRAEAQLEEFATNQAETFTTTFLSAIDDFIPPDGLRVPVNIIAELEGLTLGGFLPALENLVIPAVGTGAGGQVVVNQFFDNTPSPTTETTRAAQEASSLIR
jgi:hypothetical protein